MTLLDRQRPAIAKPTRIRSVYERGLLLDQVAALWLEGLPQSQIAQELGFTHRGVVSGAIDRARKSGDTRFPARPTRPKQTHEYRLELDRIRKARKRAGLPPLVNPAPKLRQVKPAGEEVGNRRRVSPPPEPARSVSLFELTPGMCKFAINNPPPGGHFLFCGAPTLNGPYCAAHAAGLHVASRALR